MRKDIPLIALILAFTAAVGGLIATLCLQLWEAAAPIAALAAAIATLIVAYLTYRSRPLLIRSRERHSNELKRVLRDWLKQVPEIDVVGFPGIAFPPVRIAIEDDSLFKDLKNHKPLGTDPLKGWEDYKRKCDALNEGKYDFWQKIRQYAENGTGFSLTQKNDEIGISASLINATYSDVIGLTQGVPWSRLNWEWGIIQSGTLWVVMCGVVPFAAAANEEEAKRVSDTIKNMLRNLDNRADLVSTANDLREQEKKLRELRRAMEKEIREWSLIPILPGDCEYLKRAAK